MFACPCKLFEVKLNISKDLSSLVVNLLVYVCMSLCLFDFPNFSHGLGLWSVSMNFFYDLQLQDWIDEMSAFVKSIDKSHLVTVGLEGFYGPRSSKRLTVNPESWAADLGSDFIRNSRNDHIDFASVHIYPDHWYAICFSSQAFHAIYCLTLSTIHYTDTKSFFILFIGSTIELSKKT